MVGSRIGCPAPQGAGGEEGIRTLDTVRRSRERTFALIVHKSKSTSSDGTPIALASQQSPYLHRNKPRAVAPFRKCFTYRRIHPAPIARNPHVNAETRCPS